MRRGRVALLYPTDPAASAPSGIDSFIKGVIRWSPTDLEHTLIGASTDTDERPLGRVTSVRLGDRDVPYLPIVTGNPGGTRSAIPLTLRYLMALRAFIRRGALARFDILDFHRIEPLQLFKRDARPKNLTLHLDMSSIRDKNSDILWRHAPWLYESIEKRLIDTADTVFAVRRSAVERYRRDDTHACNKYRFIPTYVDSTIFKPCATEEQRERVRLNLMQALGVTQRRRFLAFVGRLDRQKDPLLLLAAFREALKRQPDLHLLLVGDGVLRPQVEAEIRARSLSDRVSPMGVLPPAQICEVLQASELFVLASAYEGMPIAVLEALATGLPVVSTNVGEIGCIVRNGLNGFVSAERSAEALAEATCVALQRVPVMRGTPCTESVSSYHPEIVLNTIYDVHRHQLAERAL